MSTDLLSAQEGWVPAGPRALSRGVLNREPAGGHVVQSEVTVCRTLRASPVTLFVTGIPPGTISGYRRRRVASQHSEKPATMTSSIHPTVSRTPRKGASSSVLVRTKANPCCLARSSNLFAARRSGLSHIAVPPEQAEKDLTALLARDTRGWLVKLLGAGT
jgi:hypothetical protein